MPLTGSGTQKANCRRDSRELCYLAILHHPGQTEGDYGAGQFWIVGDNFGSRGQSAFCMPEPLKWIFSPAKFLTLYPFERCVVNPLVLCVLSDWPTFYEIPACNLEEYRDVSEGRASWRIRPCDRCFRWIRWVCRLYSLAVNERKWSVNELKGYCTTLSHVSLNTDLWKQVFDFLSHVAEHIIGRQQRFRVGTEIQ